MKVKSSRNCLIEHCYAENSIAIELFALHSQRTLRKKFTRLQIESYSKQLRKNSEEDYNVGNDGEKCSEQLLGCYLLMES